MSETETFYRVHWTGSPTFGADNAWSALWGSARSEDGSRTECCECDGTGASYGEPCATCDGEGWEDCQYGYSCCWSPADLIAYFGSPSRGEPLASDAVVVFEGQQVGTGCDGEPLAVPTGTVRWTTYGDLAASVQ